MLVLQWDHKIEDLTDHNITAETVDRIKAGNTGLSSAVTDEIHWNEATVDVRLLVIALCRATGTGRLSRAISL